MCGCSCFDEGVKGSSVVLGVMLMCVAAKIDVLLLFMLLYRFEGAADSSKTRLNLVFEYKVDIVVCILVNVYNMKKNTGLIVTVVSITSLYFYYI